MADQAAVAKRAAGLAKLFNAVINGHREEKSAAHANCFLEALCAQEDVAKSFRFSLDSVFLNGPATSVIQHLSHPSVEQLYGGQFLYRILEQIVQPPTF